MSEWIINGEWGDKQSAEAEFEHTQHFLHSNELISFTNLYNKFTFQTVIYSFINQVNATDLFFKKGPGLKTA